jgi:RNA polymerase sigma factor (sigma-70 family)
VDAFARRTLVNDAYLSHSRNRRRETVLAAPPDGSGASPDVAAQMDIRRALDALPPHQRALVVLRHVEDISVAEAAEILGMAEGTVKSQTAHGLANLRLSLSGE